MIDLSWRHLGLGRSQIRSNFQELPSLADICVERPRSGNRSLIDFSAPCPVCKFLHDCKRILRFATFTLAHVQIRLKRSVFFQKTDPLEAMESLKIIDFAPIMITIERKIFSYALSTQTQVSIHCNTREGAVKIRCVSFPENPYRDP